MDTISPSAPVPERSSGRWLLWLGLLLGVLGPILFAVQYGLKLLIVPWHIPVLTTLAAGLLIGSLARRRTVVRGIALILIVALAGFEWVFLTTLSRLPAYQGPAQAGRTIPAFRTTLADGRPFTETDLRDLRANLLVFFRGRW